MDNRRELEAELHEATVKAIKEAAELGVSKPSVLMFCYQAGVNVDEIYEEAR